MPLPHASTSHRCLWCDALLPEDSSVPPAPIIQCDHCGRRNRREDLALFWTLKPSVRRLQTTLEVLSVVVLAGCVVACMVHWRQLKNADNWNVVVSIIGSTLAASTVLYQSRFLTRRRGRRPSEGMLKASISVACVVIAYWIFLGLAGEDLDRPGVVFAIAVFTAVGAAMGYRIWRAARGQPL